MTRKVRAPETSPDDDTTAPPAVSTTTSIDVVDPDAGPLVNQSPLLAPASDPEREAALAQVPGPTRFRVTRSQYVLVNGHSVVMKAGKIVDTHNYDVPKLLSQGVALEPLDPG